MSLFSVTVEEHGPDDLELKVRLQATFRLRGSERNVQEALDALAEYAKLRLVRANLDGVADLVKAEGALSEAEYKAGLDLVDLVLGKARDHLSNLGVKEE